MNNLIDVLKDSLKNCKIIKENKDHIISVLSGDDVNGLFSFEINTLRKDRTSHPIVFRSYLALCSNADLFRINKFHICYLRFLSDKEIFELQSNEIDNVLSYIAYKFIKQEYPNRKHINCSYPIAMDVNDTHLWLNKDRWKYVDFMIDNITEILKKLES